MSENNKFVSWVKAHKTESIIAGVSVTAIIGMILLASRTRDAIKELWDALENSLSKTPDKIYEPVTIVQTAQPVLEEVTPVRLYTSPQKPFDVSQHIRNLSGGRHHSNEKAAEAAALGITLLPNQTLVDTYTKCAA